MSDDAAQASTTFIVRASQDAHGRLHGIVERVKTGEKQRFTGADGLGGVIEKMLVAEPRSSHASCPDGARRPRRRR